MRTNAWDHLESEIAFVITNSGRTISQDLARVKSILQFDLRPRPLQRINDTYFDSPSGLLRSRRTILRVRRIDHVRLITLKSNPKKLKGRGVARTEIELPWSSTSLLKVMKRLRLRERTAGRQRFSSISPAKVLETYDLQAIQERRTIRTVRDIVPMDTHGPRLAELALDDTTFTFGKTHVKLYELEIEAKITRSFHQIQKIADAIVTPHRGSLRYWVHGKFVTGLAMQNLLEKGVLQTHLVKSRLRKDAFPLIDRTIRSRKL